LGVGPNVGTPQGYVHNPLTWVDTLGLAAHKVDLGMPKMPHATDANRWADGTFRPGNGGSPNIGSAAVEDVKSHLQKQGYEVVGEQVRMTNGSHTTVTDLIVKDDAGKLYPVEVKSGGASQTTAQRDVYTSLKNGDDVSFTGSRASDLKLDGKNIGQGMGFRVDNSGAIKPMRLGRIR
jgi:hypothetical protein